MKYRTRKLRKRRYIKGGGWFGILTKATKATSDTSDVDSVHRISADQRDQIYETMSAEAANNFPDKPWLETSLVTNKRILVTRLSVDGLPVAEQERRLEEFLKHFPLEDMVANETAKRANGRKTLEADIDNARVRHVLVNKQDVVAREKELIKVMNHITSTTGSVGKEFADAMKNVNKAKGARIQAALDAASELSARERMLDTYLQRWSMEGIRSTRIAILSLEYDLPYNTVIAFAAHAADAQKLLAADIQPAEAAMAAAKIFNKEEKVHDVTFGNNPEWRYAADTSEHWDKVHNNANTIQKHLLPAARRRNLIANLKEKIAKKIFTQQEVDKILSDWDERNPYTADAEEMGAGAKGGKGPRTRKVRRGRRKVHGTKKKFNRRKTRRKRIK